jgi:hypothetical protein
MFAAVGVLGGIAFIVALVRSFSTDEGQASARSFSEVATLLQEAQAAPGAEEVAKKGGCLQALVMDTQKLEELAVTSDGRDGGKKPSSQVRTMVTCQVGFGKSPPACELLAATYAQATHPTAPFRVAVQKQGDPNRTCDQSFDASGKPLAPAASAAQAAPAAPGEPGKAADAAAELPPTISLPTPGALPLLDLGDAGSPNPSGSEGDAGHDGGAR